MTPGQPTALAIYEEAAQALEALTKRRLATVQQQLRE